MTNGAQPAIGAQPTMGALLLPVGFGAGDPGEALEPILTTLRVAAAAAGRSVIWAEVRREVARRLAEILDVDVSDVVVAAWEKAEEFRDYADRELHPPDETIVTELAEHTIEVDYHPSLEFLLNGNAIPAVKLDVILSLIVKGLILKIRDGKVREVTAGSIKGRGRLETAGKTFLKRETEEILLPRARKTETPSDAPQPLLAPS